MMKMKREADYFHPKTIMSNHDKGGRTKERKKKLKTKKKVIILKNKKNS